MIKSNKVTAKKRKSRERMSPETIDVTNVLTNLFKSFGSIYSNQKHNEARRF